MLNTNNPSPEYINTLSGDHLKNKGDMIQTCMHNSLDHTESLVDMLVTGEYDDIAYGPAAHCARDPEVFSEVLNIVSGNRSHSVVFSKINNHNKFSKGYYNCTGIVAIGRDKANNENISFLVHQDPAYFLRLDGQQEAYKASLTSLLMALKNSSKPGTIDIIILGGRGDIGAYGEVNLKEYKEGITQTDTIISQVMGFHPVVIGGPMFINGLTLKQQSKTVFVDTANRRVHFVKMSPMIESNGHFVANGINNVIKQLMAK